MARGLGIGLAAAAALGIGARPGAGQAAVAVPIKTRVEQLRVAGELAIRGEDLEAAAWLAELYERRGFEPVWSDEAQAAELRRAILASREDGLDPADYHLAPIETLAAVGRTPEEAAELDLLLTDALLRLAHDLRFGRVDPARPDAVAAVDRPLPGPDPIAAVEALVAPGPIAARVAALRPAHLVYRGLMEALAALRRVEAAGGWLRVPEGPAMRLDSADARVPVLRARLRAGGDLAGPAPGDSLFDAALDAAVRAFQHRHALNEDGVVGPATLAELNVPLARRIDQVRVNLERARWFLHDFPETYVTVNIAGAMVYMVRAGTAVFEARAIVGEPGTRTPVFTAPMRYIDVNPTWTVPPGIVGEVLAAVRRDAGWLRREGMRVLDRSGRSVDPSTIAFSRWSARTFPYVFRQDPGPRNPLGEIKFVFPNRYNVYLHDTPARQLFQREQRTFSHGCIRVQNPLRLAEVLLDDSVRWSADSIRAAIATGTTRTIPLERPIPVIVLYWTATADLHGELHFHRDVYGRDTPILRALDR